MFNRMRAEGKHFYFLATLAKWIGERPNRKIIKMNFDWNLKAQPERTVVNYLWMDRVPSRPRPIPTYLFCRVQENAERYPTAQFRVWAERPDVADDYLIPPNVSIFDLGEIPSFSQTPLMRRRAQHLIWAKVDVARLQILRHVLAEPGVETAVYADMDVQDLWLQHVQLTKRLETFGCAFGATFHQVEDLRNVDNNFENGYMAFRRTAADLLSHLTEQMEVIKPGEVRDRNSIYRQLPGLICDWADHHEHFPQSWKRNVASLPVLYRSRHRKFRHLQAKPAPLAALEP